MVFCSSCFMPLRKRPTGTYPTTAPSRARGMLYVLVGFLLITAAGTVQRLRHFAGAPREAAQLQSDRREAHALRRVMPSSCTSGRVSFSTRTPGLRRAFFAASVFAISCFGRFYR